MDPASGSWTDQHAFKNDRNVDRKDCSGGFKLQQRPIGNWIICITSWQRNSPDFVYALGFCWKLRCFVFFLICDYCYYHYYYCEWLCMYVLDMWGRCMCFTAHLWRWEDNIEEIVLSFQLCGNQNQIISLAWQLTLLTKTLRWLKKLSLNVMDCLIWWKELQTAQHTGSCMNFACCFSLW